MITFIQARVPRTSISKHYQQKAHFCDLSLCTDVPPPSEKNREKRFCFLREGGRRYTGYATCAFTKEHFMNLLSRGDGRGGDVSKEICGTVRLPVWRHVSRQ